MGVYNDRVLPRILNASCGSKKLDPLRRRVCASLAGEVVEIGSGSGLNIPFYPAGIARLAAVEPSDVSWKLAGELDEPYYVQFNTAHQEIGLDPNSHSKSMTGPVCHWHVEDIQGSVAHLFAAGATELQAVSDLGAGKLIASVADDDGNVIGLIRVP